MEKEVILAKFSILILIPVAGLFTYPIGPNVDKKNGLVGCSEGGLTLPTDVRPESIIDSFYLIIM